ncbi:MAG: hypothetical protein JW913_13560 [Chitinispirillaceae bacterium]|nr:hypothetical protein [Chitinispirillaceae bacterium]
MVVKMKRLELLLYHQERERFLAELKKLGVVHIVEEEQVAEAPDVQSLGAALRRSERVMTFLQKIKKERTQASALHKTAFTPEALLDRFEELEEQVEKGNQELAALRKDIKALESWGNFDSSSVKDLQKAGIRIRFFTATEKAFDAIDRKTVTAEEIVRRDRQVYFVVIERGEAAVVQAEEVRLPDASLASLQKAVKERGASIASSRGEMEALTWNIDTLAGHVDESKEALAHARARLSMSEQAGGRVLYLKGWMPAKKEKAVTKLLESFTVWFKISEPLPTDAIPVMVRNGPFAKLFEPIMKIYCLPDYFELDPTPFFAPFFVIFVGLCLGDLGYGLLVILLGILAAVKAPVSMRPIAMLVIVLGFSTACAGILLNGAFGHTIFGGPGIREGTAFFPTGARILSPLGAIETEKGQVFPMMSFALAIGVLQLFFGMILKATNQVLQGCIAGAIQPLASLCMVLFTLMIAAHAHYMDMHLLTIGPLKIGALLTALPPAIPPKLIIVAIVLFFLFNNLQLKIFLRPLMGIYEFYNFVSGIFGNILSYIRLFALGLASGLLGAAFNTIAFMFITKDGQVHYASPLIIGTIVVLLVGHAINFSLAIIGAFVHPLRLTFVEFYGSLSFKGGGKPYSPFRQLKTVEKSQ